MIHFPDILGLIGVLIMLIAYFLLNIHKISIKSYGYPLLNALGSLCVLYSLLYQWNLSAFMMELAWLLISLYGIYAVWRTKIK